MKFRIIGSIVFVVLAIMMYLFLSAIRNSGSEGTGEGAVVSEVQQ